MEKSPLSAALKPNVSAGDEAEQRYQDALSELMERLDTRKNRLFDPTLLAMAQGFLTPGRTGSFGEALGNVAQRVGTAEQQRQKEDIDLAQLRLQVAQGAREQASRLKGIEAFRGLLPGAAPLAVTESGAVGQAAEPATGQAGEQATAAPGQAPAAGQAPDQGGVRSVSMTDALKFAAAFPEQKELAKLLAEAAKFESDRFKISMNGTVFDTVTKKFVAQIPPGQTASEFFIPDAGGTLLITPGQHAEYQEARAKGKGKEWVNNYFKTEEGKPPEILTQQVLRQREEERKQTPSKYLIPEIGGEVSMTPAKYQEYLAARGRGQAQAWAQQFMSSAPSAQAGKPLTAAEVEAQSAARKAEEESVAKASAERFNNAISKGDDAGSRISLYQRIAATASQKDADKILGVFEKGGFGDALLRMLESRDPKAGTITGKDIRDIWTNLGLKAELIADKQVLVSLIAQSQFDFRSLAKGQGAISDMETRLFNSMGADISDRPEAVVRKMKMLELRANFDREVSRMARNARKQGISYDDMKDSETYRAAYDRYMSNLMNQVTGSGRNVISAPAAPSGKPQTPSGAPAAGRPSTRVFPGRAGPNTIWEIQPDGSYADTGRKAP